MCGIVGYVGHREASQFLIEGLRRLEYRGYDSSGVAAIDSGGHMAVTKTKGRIENLVERLAQNPIGGKIGVGHTRWATHGQPSDENAHPHIGGSEVLAIVHNGVIENYQQLKEHLIDKGYIFHSATDSEIIGHLISDYLQNASEAEINGIATQSVAGTYAPLVAAVKHAIAQLRGTYGIVVLFRDYPDVLVCARLGSPMVIGVGESEHFIASDATAMVGHTDKIVYLADHELAVITHDSLQVMHRDQGQIAHAVQTLEQDGGSVSLAGYAHYMLKEIHEQPQSLRNAMRGRLSQDDATAVFGGLNLGTQQLRQVDRIILTACGTSWHAALVGEYVIEELAGIPVEVEYASELRYRNPPLGDKTLVFAITQSGETADTLAALRECKRKGHHTLAICNVVGSTIAQESEGGIYLHAGPEIGVASTKAFTAQCTVLAMLALFFGRQRHVSYGAGRAIIQHLKQLPERV